MDIQFEAQSGKIILPTNFKTIVSYHFEGQTEPIQEE